MRRCYRGIALALGGVLITSPVSLGSDSFGLMTVYAEEDVLTEELETAFQEEVQTGGENVETEIPNEEAVEQPVEETTEEAAPEEAVTEEPAPEAVPTAGNAVGLEEQEYQILLRIVEAEAGGEDTFGKMLVANVVMNRVRSGHFPNTISEVVYQRSGGSAQFSPTADGRINQVTVSEDTVAAVSRALSGEDGSAGALFFRSVNCRSGWFDQALNRVLEYGNHVFYTM